jgi:hypothetical protein
LPHGLMPWTWGGSKSAGRVGEGGDPQRSEIKVPEPRGSQSVEAPLTTASHYLHLTLRGYSRNTACNPHRTQQYLRPHPGSHC